MIYSPNGLMRYNDSNPIVDDMPLLSQWIKKFLFRRTGIFLEAPPRLELGVKVLQTSALPLGYGALCYLKGAYISALLFGAGYEARTRYLHLGKVALYQMS